MQYEILFVRENDMKYYSTWQQALSEFIQRYGHNYEDGYNLVVEFENKLQKNVHGVYFIIWE